jgi:hypothetical protein
METGRGAPPANLSAQSHPRPAGNGMFIELTEKPAKTTFRLDTSVFAEKNEPPSCQIF